MGPRRSAGSPVNVLALGLLLLSALSIIAASFPGRKSTGENSFGARDGKGSS